MDIAPKRDEDQYGHWWIEIANGTESYGWWPNTLQLGLRDTLVGVPGVLNGVGVVEDGTETRDPHHGERKFVEVADVWGEVGVSPSEYEDRVRRFARAYSGSWSWPLGQNCHSFQRALLMSAGLSLSP